MHSDYFNEGKTCWSAHFHSDLSGHIIFHRQNSDGEKELHVPSELVKSIIANHIRSNQIEQLENASTEEILKGIIK